jgi:hypothetical protein
MTMFVTPQPTNVIKATLILSIMLHGLVLLALSGSSQESTEKVRIIAKVDVVDDIQLPEKPKAAALPRIKVPPPPKIPVQRPGHKGTRPGVGGDPAPAAKSLRMDLPKAQRPPAVNPRSSVLRGKSIGGDPERGTAFGDPDGVHGGTGTGGTGPGGTGGDGDGGQSVAADASPEEILRAGIIDCNGCHVNRASMAGDPPQPTRPLNLEMMSLNTGWQINQHPTRQGGLEAEYEYELDPSGKVLNIRVLKAPYNPQIREVLQYFASMAQWTPPGVHCYAIMPIKFHPPAFESR